MSIQVQQLTVDIDKEKAEANLQRFKERHEEELSALKPHQIEMTCQFWALTSMGMKKPEEEEADE